MTSRFAFLFFICFLYVSLQPKCKLDRNVDEERRSFDAYTYGEAHDHASAASPDGIAFYACHHGTDIVYYHAVYRCFHGGKPGR